MAAYNILETAKYYCTLSTLKYERPKPFDPSSYAVERIIRLPLPQELRDDTAVAYNNVDLKLVGDIANGSLATGLGAEILRQSGGALAGGANAVAQGLMRAGSASASVGTGLMAGAVGKGIQNAVDPEAITSAIQQGAGVAPNPNPSVAFQGPSLREMSFSWTFMPTNAKDSQRIREIINYLKSAALPRADKSGDTAAILDYPHLVQMNFFPWDNGGGDAYGWSENSIIKMKRCFMASVNVNYTAGAAPSFFAGFNNEPTIIQLSINMKEIEYFMAHDYGDTTSSKGFLGGLNQLLSNSPEFNTLIGDAAQQPPAGDEAANPTDGASQT